LKKEKDTACFQPGDVTHRLLITNQMHRRMIDKSLEGTGVHRAQHRLLMTLSRNHHISQVELARHLEVTPATIAITLKAMEKKGLICREVKKNDNRANFVKLTKKGKDIVENSKDFFALLDEQMYLGFSDCERETLAGYLERIYDNMEQMSNQSERRMEEENGTV
jgi:DNA-binding MarR family transcriptional regulator